MKKSNRFWAAGMLMLGTATLHAQSTTNNSCTSTGNTTFEYINRVQLSLDYTATGNNNGYTDLTYFAYFRPQLTPGTSSTMTLTPGFTGIAYVEYWRVWVDYNKDGDFNDAGEQVGQATGSGAVNISFIPPSGISGFTRMRVTMKYGSYPTTCESSYEGETEDYRVQLGQPVPCASRGSNTELEYIGQVALSSGNVNTSGNDAGYRNFGHVFASILPGTNYTMKLSPIFTVSSYNEYWRAWIDYNNDGDFDDAGETLGQASGSGQVSINYTTLSVESAAGAGSFRMRVAMKFDSYPTPCETFAYGEVEDYIITISPPNPRPFYRTLQEGTLAQTQAGQAIELYPNPARDQVHITWKAREAAPATITLSDITGRQLARVQHNGTVGDNDYLLPLQDIPAGNYLVNLQEGGRQHNYKLTVTR